MIDRAAILQRILDAGIVAVVRCDDPKPIAKGLIALAERSPQDAVALLRGYLAKRTNLAPDPPEKEARYSLAEASACSCP